MRFPFLASVVLVLCTGCSSNSGVVSLGADRFTVSRQAASGFSGLGTLKAEALREAGEHCSKVGKTVYVIRARESEPPYVFGNFPRAEVEFMCLDPNDPRLTTADPG